MNQKKCPKCGETNPAEAVMCWACYTPLTGGAVAAGAGGAGALAQPHAAAGHDEEGKKAIPPWQIGILAVALLGGLGFGVTQMMGGGDEGDPGGPSNNFVSKPPGNSVGGPMKPPGPITTGGITGGTTGTGVPGGGNTGGTVTETRAPFKLVASPNPQAQWGVFGIVPTDANVSSAKAASLAAFAGRQYRRNAPWSAMQIFVFQNPQAAQAFKEYQSPRKQEVLTDGDYAALVSVWPDCLARYEFNGGKASYRYPSKSPESWWR